MPMVGEYSTHDLNLQCAYFRRNGWKRGVVFVDISIKDGNGQIEKTEGKNERMISLKKGEMVALDIDMR